jgi:predicted nucleic acid-binding protein
MTVFVDTSAVFAVLSSDDDNHASAAVEWERLIADDEPLITSNYVALEVHAVLQARFGMDAVQVWVNAVEPALRLHWVDQGTHESAVTALLAANRRGVSLVDYTSFVVMRELGIARAFAFDPHFAEQGFTVLPA